MTEYLRRQMIRQDYARAVAAADQCLLHPRLKASVEVLLLKGSALSAMRRFPDADLTLKKAIRICQEKAKGRPVTVLPVLVLCMCEQAKALAGGGQSKAAQKVLQQAQDILVNKTPGQELVGLVFSGKAETRDFFYDRIGSCSCIAAARLLQEKSRFPEQKEQYEEAVELLEKSSVFIREANCRYPDPMGVSVRADIMNMKGYIQWENDDGYSAGQAFSGAKAMIEELRVLMPDAWPVLLADICNNRGIKLTDNPYHYNDAKQEYLFAAKLLTEEAPGSPSATEMLGDCYYDLGLLYSEWGKKNKAEEYYKKARKEYLTVGKNAMKEKLDLLAKDRREN